MIADFPPFTATMTDLSGRQRIIKDIFTPQTRAEVARLLERARLDGIPLHTVSCGRNWGFGSQLPPVDGAYVLNLSGLNRILELNLDEDYVDLEPGVTQGMLDDALAQAGRTHYFNVTGAGRQTSVLGNALERGIGYFGPRHEDLLDLEVLLADGTVIRTAPAPYHTGLGLDARALFIQSSLGIVLSAKIALRRRPEVMGVMVAKPRQGIGGLVASLSRMQSERLIASVPHIANRQRAYITMAPHVPAAMREVCRQAMAPWSALIPISGPERVVSATVTHLETNLGADCQFVSTANPPSDRSLMPLLDLARGIPTDLALAGVSFAALGEVEPGDLDQGRAGLIHIVPSCAPRCVQDLLSLIDDHLTKPAVTLNLVNTGMVVAVVALPFILRDDASMAQARASAHALLSACVERGFIPYRLGLEQNVPAAGEIEARLRSVLDPQGLLCLSKYSQTSTSVAAL